MRRGTLIRRFIEVSGGVQLLLTLLGVAGINLGTAIGVGRVVAPQSFWEYAFLVAVFLAVTPVSFPLSAFALNVGLRQVEKLRRRDVFDDPLETTRKKIDGHIVTGRDLADQLPPDPVPGPNLVYHQQRAAHWVLGVDADLARSAGPLAAKWFTINDEEDSWRLVPPPLSSARIRRDLDRYTSRLRAIRNALPIDHRKWLRLAVALDIASAKTLLEFLRGGGVAADNDTYGSGELSKWVGSVRASFREDLPEYAHLFTEESIGGLSNPRERGKYVEGRLTELEKIWRSVE